MSAKSTAVSKSASAKTTLGFLPPSSSATFFTRRGGRGHDPLAGRHAPGEGHHVDVRVLGERRARLGPGTEDEVGHTRGQPGLLQRPHQQDRGGRGELAGLEDDRVARQSAGATFQLACSSG